MVRVAINGFGRIGRQVLRIGLQFPEIEFVAINDLTDSKTMAHLFKYDSSYGKFNGTVSVDDKHIIVNGRRIPVFAEKEPENLPWKELNVDIVMESTGAFTSKDGAQKHITAGARKVLISAPAKGGVKTIVMGVNENTYDKEHDHIISNASCTTNCLAPVVKVLNDNFGIEKGFMTTIHAYTNDQKILDLPHKDLRRARSAAVNIVPTTTGAAEAVGQVIPELKGKLTGMAVRVPVPVGSLTDFVCILRKNTTKEEINWLFSEVAKHHLKNVLEYSDEPLVSSDIVGNSHSSIFDSLSTMVLDGNYVKVVSWYDNEWGYSCRIVDMLRMIL
jgi:glyceraldehyde 3-phosphate dehydrogenase